MDSLASFFGSSGADAASSAAMAGGTTADAPANLGLGGDTWGWRRSRRTAGTEHELERRTPKVDLLWPGAAGARRADRRGPSAADRLHVALSGRRRHGGRRHGPTERDAPAAARRQYRRAARGRGGH